MKQILRSLFSSLGYQVTRLEPTQMGPQGYDLEEEARQSINVVREHTMVPYQRLVTLYQQAVFCERNDIEGSFVECGTWRGGAVGLMALANLRYGAARRHIHLFDSFEGIPEPDELVDGEEALKFAHAVGGGVNGKLIPLRNQYASVGTLEANRQFLERQLKYDPRYLHYHKGWFQDTVPKDAPECGEIAILRLDGDWYASTHICLETLYDQVVSGGFIIHDDYGYYDGCRKAVDEFVERRNLNIYFHHIDPAGRYWIKS